MLKFFWETWSQWKKIVIDHQEKMDAIDWAQVESAMRLSGIKHGDGPLIFEGLQVMQNEALEILNWS